jgi:hypothetical protein
MLALILIIVNITGCKSNNYVEDATPQTSLNVTKNTVQPSLFVSTTSDQIHDLTQDKAQLQIKIDQQNQAIGELTKTIDDLKYQAGVLDELMKDHPWLQQFSHPQSIIKSIKVTLDSNTNTAVIVTDPQLLKMFSGGLYITRELFGLHSGGTYDSDILPCNYQISLNNGEAYGITLNARGVLTFDQLQNHDFETSAYLHQLCKAVIKKPFYMPDLSLYAKMADSGMLLEDPNGVFYFSSSRIQGLIYAFLRADKTKVTDPIHPGDAIEQYTFYSYGERTNMNLYEQYIQIIDHGKQTWLKVDKIVPIQIRSVLTAG